MARGGGWEPATLCPGEAAEARGEGWEPEALCHAVGWGSAAQDVETERNRTELHAEAAPHDTAPRARGRTGLQLGVGYTLQVERMSVLWGQLH